MTDLPDTVRHARRFVVRHPGQPDIHGVQFPSGRVVYDQPSIGLEVATSIDHIRTANLAGDLASTPDAAIHWADEDGQP